MESKEKLRERFKRKPKDFTFEETITLLSGFGYHIHHKGKTSGSRIRFMNEEKGIYIDIHKLKMVLTAILKPVRQTEWNLQSLIVAG
ncbi:MAG: type II toxin-antitoxin system HicA family toxin [Prevotella sp.]|nr:type II toxin-antitoxin system HicA family toxin [Prevotella sp.]